MYNKIEYETKDAETADRFRKATIIFSKRLFLDLIWKCSEITPPGLKRELQEIEDSKELHITFSKDEIRYITDHIKTKIASLERRKKSEDVILPYREVGTKFFPAAREVGTDIF